MATASGGVVALAFIGQVSAAGQAFFLFALALLPTLLLLGVLTYIRLTQSAIEDALYARAINRIRHYYTEIDPAAAPYFLLSGHDDVPGMLRNQGQRESRWHLLSHTALVIAAVNSMLAGVALSLAVRVALGASTVAGATVGVLTATLVAAAFLVHQSRRWVAAQLAVPALFATAVAGYDGGE